jgi:hypothetical protein
VAAAVGVPETQLPVLVQPVVVDLILDILV